MSQLDEFNQNNLLFKRFQGVVQTNIVNPNTYDGEFGKEALVNTYNDTIFSSNVTKDLSANNTLSNLALQLPGAPSVSDTSANSWDTGIYGEYSDLKTSQNESVTNLKFYQKVFLKSISSGPYAWWLVDPSNADLSTTNNLLKDMIPFSYGTTGATYSPVVWYYSGQIPTSAVDAENKANDPNNWTPDFNQNSTPLYWLVDYASGVLQFYAEADLNGHIPTTGGNKIKPTSNPANWIGGKPDPTSVPRISFIKYVGEKGAAGGGGGGDASGNLDLSGNLSVGGDADISGNLTVVGDASFCNVLVNCDLDVSGNTDMSGNLTVDGNISVVGDADFCNVLVRCDLDVNGNTDLSQNLLQATASTDLTASGVTDYNAYFRQSNIIDSMKLPFSTYFDDFWTQMVDRTVSGPTAWRQGNPCPFGPNLIPIAKIDINSSYSNTTLASQEQSLRPLLANTIGYFTVKFAQPSMQEWENDSSLNIKKEFSNDGGWTATMGQDGTKPGYNCIPEQTIHFLAGYQEQQYDVDGENRNPKPFIKILSCSFGDIRNVNGETIIFTGSDPVTDTAGVYTGKKIGGITRIVIAEGLIKLHRGEKGGPVPAEDTSGKAWLLLEQTWAYEGWMKRQPGNRQVDILRKICGNHNIEVRLYCNNTGAKMFGRNNPPEMINANLINTDWQLLSNDFIISNFVDKWEIGKQPSFLLKGLPNTIFNPPADVDNLPNPPIPATQTLYVGGQKNPPGKLAIGIGETFTNKFWFVDLNVYNWPYGITTTKEIFKFNVDVCGDLDVSGNLGVVGNSTFENITVTNNLDVQGDTTLKNTTVDGKIRADIVESSGNSIFVSYKNYNNEEYHCQSEYVH